MQTIVFLLALAALQPEIDLVRRYVEAIGGADALRAVRTRVTDGEFNDYPRNAPNEPRARRTGLASTLAGSAPLMSGRTANGRSGAYG